MYSIIAQLSFVSYDLLALSSMVLVILVIQDSIYFSPSFGSFVDQMGLVEF